MEVSISYLKTTLCDTLLLRLQVPSSLSTATNRYYNYKLAAVILEDINNYQSVSEPLLLFCMRFNKEAMVKDLGCPYILKKKKTVNLIFASLLNADYRGIGCT